jgi:hypothetical protein
MTSKAVTQILDRAEQNKGQLQRMILELKPLTEQEAIQLFQKTYQPGTKAAKRGGVRAVSIPNV